jgi:hypothetical protein
MTLAEVLDADADGAVIEFSDDELRLGVKEAKAVFKSPALFRAWKRAWKLSWRDVAWRCSAQAAEHGEEESREGGGAGRGRRREERDEARGKGGRERRGRV